MTSCLSNKGNLWQVITGEQIKGLPNKLFGVFKKELDTKLAEEKAKRQAERERKQ